MSEHETGLGSRSGVWVVAVLVAVVFTVLGTPRPAYAHNVLVSTTPAAGSTVAVPPDAIVLTFNEPAIATGTMVLVTGPDGPATAGEPQLVDTTVRQDLMQGLPAGQYTVNWRVTSADGHPVNGTFTFRARAGAHLTTNGSPSPATSPTAASPAATSPTAASPASPAVSTAPTAAEPGGRSGWWWLLLVVPVGLAAVLGWRFSRRTG